MTWCVVTALESVVIYRQYKNSFNICRISKDKLKITQNLWLFMYFVRTITILKGSYFSMIKGLFWLS